MNNDSASRHHAGHDIQVQVKSEYLEDQSNPAESRYVFAYHVRITNAGDRTARLLTRHWVIMDGEARIQEVRGDGVVGEQPVIQPGESFRYTSGCPLTTPSGIMVGTYRMVGADGVGFDAEIPAFSLDSPFARRTLN